VAFWEGAVHRVSGQWKFRATWNIWDDFCSYVKNTWLVTSAGFWSITAFGLIAENCEESSTLGGY